MRFIAENVLLFLLPTAMYLGYMLLTRRTASPPAAMLSEAPLVWLFIAGALLVGATIVYYASITPGGSISQVYTPPRVKDGRIEPGQL
jgi:hypothetical protein